MWVFILTYLLGFTSVYSWCADGSINAGHMVMELDYSPNGNYIVAGIQNQMARLYYTVNRTLKCSFNAGYQPKAIKFFPTSDKFAYGFEESNLKIVSDSCVQIRSLNTGHSKIHGIDFSYDGTLMLTCGEDQKFKVWNISGINLATTNPPMIGGDFVTGFVVWSCKFSSNNHVLVGNEGTSSVIKVYGPTFTNSLIRSYSRSDSGKSLAVQFFHCQNSPRIIMGSSDNGKYYWYNGTSTASTIALSQIFHSGAHAYLAKIDRTNQFIVYGGQNNKFQIYKVSDLSNKQSFSLPAKVYSGDFSDDAQNLAIGNENYLIYFYKRCSGCTQTTAYMNQFCQLPFINVPSCGITCPQNKYLNTTTNNCQNCHYSCLTCSGGLNTSCLSCSAANFRIFNSATSECLCLSGYFQNGNTLCATCSSQCLTCVSSATYCLTCNTATHNRIINLTSNTCPCIDGYYETSLYTPLICLACNPACLTCSLASTNCRTCSINQNRILSTSNNSCICKDGFFETSINNPAICLACNINCQTCSITSTNCTSCNSTHIRVLNSTSYYCMCADGFYEISNTNPVTCLTCNPTCITCLTSASICTSCDLITQMRILDSTSQTCICTNGFYETSPGAPTICLPCDPICLTCQSSPGYCTSCNATNNRILSNNSCICSNGFYENSVGSPLVCLACHPTCITCTTSSTTCQSCDLAIQHRTFNSTSSICECISGYYETSLNNPTNCLPIGCHYSCLTCSGGLNTSCLSCSAADFRIFNSATSECLCLSGYFQNGNTLCATCSSQCLTCVSSATYCLTCNTATHNRIINLTSNTCPCIDGYYETSLYTPLICLACNPACLTCSLASTNCRTCSINQNRILSTSNNSCICKDGFFETSINNPAICLACNINCQTCSITSTNCTSCNSTHIRVLNSTSYYCMCADGFYEISNTNPVTCLTCNPTCITCLTSASICTSCDLITQMRILDSTSQTCICTNGFYETSPGAPTICLPCDPICLTCQSSPGYCTSCNATNNRILSNNSCICSNGFYENSVGSPLVCLACHPTCITCTTSSTTCQSCDLAIQHRTFNSTSSICECISGYYETSLNNPTNCLPIGCHYSCLTCSGGLNTSCLSCSAADFRIFNSATSECLCLSGYFQNGNTLCATCSSQCLTCVSSATYCLTCNTATHNRIINLTSNTCPCIDGYYETSLYTPLICLACNPTCLTCSLASTNCRTCSINQNRILSTSNNSCICKDGFFETSINNPAICLACNINCQTCSITSTNCTSCNSTHIRVLNSTSYYCMCADGFYEISNTNPVTCLTCNPTCITCLTSASICTSCDLITQMRILDSTSQTCICTNGFYETSPGAPTICLPCDPICLTCQSSPGYCTSCNATNNRILSNNSCICSNGFYENSVGSPLVCLACHPTCITCTTSSTTCQSCDLAIQHRTFNSTSSICECISGYYETSLNNPTNCLPLPSDNITVQEFFKNYLSSIFLNNLFLSDKVQIITQSGLQCNTLITTIKTGQKSCTDYYKWNKYIRIFHPNITQTSLYCQDQKTLVIQSIIIDQIYDDKVMYIILPKEDKLTQNITALSLTQWMQLLMRISANYDSVIAPAYYSPTQCQNKQANFIFLKAIAGVAIAITFIGILNAKIVGLQLFGLLQLAFFNLANHQSLNINLYHLTKFNFFNGINFKLVDEKAQVMPHLISKMGMNTQFLNNMNAMILLTIVIFFIFIIGYYITKKAYPTISNMFMRLLKESMVTLAMFNALNIGFSLGIHLRYSDKGSISPIFHFFSSLSIFVVIGAIIGIIICLKSTMENTFGEFKSKYKRSWQNKSYIIFSILFRIILGLYLAYENQYRQASIFSLGIAMIFIMYNIINLPFDDFIHNYRACIIHISTAIILLIANYYGSMKTNVEIQIKSKLHTAAYVQYVVLGICTILSFICVIYEVYKFCKQITQQKKLNKVNIQRSRNETLEDMEVSQL